MKNDLDSKLLSRLRSNSIFMEGKIKVFSINLIRFDNHSKLIVVAPYIEQNPQQRMISVMFKRLLLIFFLFLQLLHYIWILISHFPSTILTKVIELLIFFYKRTSQTYISRLSDFIILFFADIADHIVSIHILNIKKLVRLVVGAYLFWDIV